MGTTQLARTGGQSPIGLRGDENVAMMPSIWAAAVVAMVVAGDEVVHRHRTVDHSHRGSEHEHYVQQRKRVERAVGDYRFYIYGGGPFDSLTSDLLRGREATADNLYMLAEHKVTNKPQFSLGFLATRAAFCPLLHHGCRSSTSQ